MVKGSLKEANQFHRTVPQPGKEQPASEVKDIARSAEAEARARREDAEHEKNVKAADAYWHQRAEARDWDCIRPDLSVYRYCGEKITEDPRRTEEYRKRVVEGLGFGEKATRPGLTAADIAACREVFHRKAGAFWIEGEKRTALRYLLHDTIPTGPPVRTPPHRLKGEEAEWVDQQLQSEVQSGQLKRGNSAWASPPFATKDFPEHRRQRKRRVVVDYRRVNARMARAVYVVRNADAVVQETAGSMWMSMVDACKGFNQIPNTLRAQEMLCIGSRSGSYLPICLTFGPTNGPEDFALATDRVYAPGRGRKQRFCNQWQLYADAMAARTGRWQDGRYWSDAERSARIRSAAQKEVEARTNLDETFRAMGFNPDPLGSEKGVVGDRGIPAGRISLTCRKSKC